MERSAVPLGDAASRGSTFVSRNGTSAAGSGLLVPGRNCWRIERAHRLAFLIDAAAYFAAVRSDIAQAKRSVFILGWDFDSRIRLVPQGANDGYLAAASLGA